MQGRKRSWKPYEKGGVFLDRNGVFNADHGYVHRPEEVDFINGIFDLIAFANRALYLVANVTNQASGCCYLLKILMQPRAFLGCKTCGSVLVPENGLSF